MANWAIGLNARAYPRSTRARVQVLLDRQLSGFLERYTPALAAEVTLQPITPR